MFHQNDSKKKERENGRERERERVDLTNRVHNAEKSEKNSQDAVELKAVQKAKGAPKPNSDWRKIMNIPRDQSAGLKK